MIEYYKITGLMLNDYIDVTDELDIPFPGEKFDNYIKKVNITDKLLSYKWHHNAIKKLFLLIIADFKRGKVSLDELSSMGGYLWGKMGGYLWMDTESRHSSELRDALEAASELSFYVRVVEDQICADTFIDFLQSVLNYYEKYKSQAEK